MLWSPLLSILLLTTDPAPSPVTAPPVEARLSGRVRHAGQPPRLKTLSNEIDPDVCGRQIRPDTLRRARDGGLAEVLVELRTLDDQSPDAPWPERREPLVLELERCRFEPRLLVIPTGSPLDVVSRDGVLHELLALSVRNEVGRLRMPRYRRRARLSAPHFARPERIEVVCERHDWARANWVVSDHRLLAVTVRDGSFAIEKIPPGTYLLRTWHPDLGQSEREVELLPGADMQLELALP